MKIRLIHLKRIAGNLRGDSIIVTVDMTPNWLEWLFGDRERIAEFFGFIDDRECREWYNNTTGVRCDHGLNLAITQLVEMAT